MIVARVRTCLLAVAVAAATLPAAQAAAAEPLTFGIYPGGEAGTVGQSGRLLPENPAVRLAALEQLRGSADRPFVLHLYDQFTVRQDGAGFPSRLTDQIAEYTAAGFLVEVVSRYRPAAAGGDVAGYLRFIRNRVRQLGPNPRVIGLQVTNEANIRVAPNAADGAYRGARKALVRGVVVAKREARSRGHRQLRIGFNWAHQQGRAEVGFWRGLRRTAIRHRIARKFRRSVDWVGLDVYPGTWGPWLPSRTFAGGIRRTTTHALKLLRTEYLPMARLGRKALHISEAGYPTGSGRSEAAQRSVLRTVTRMIARMRKRYGVTDYRWFDLRDADSLGGFESQYGLMRDDYSPKPAFSAYRDIISALG